MTPPKAAKGWAWLALVVLAGCSNEPVYSYRTNQKERQRIFKECMAALPAGPQSTKYNDWDEVVSECDSVAYRQAQERYCYANCTITVSEDER